LQRPFPVAFAGTPAFAVPTLERLSAIGADVRLVLTQPDRPAGRGRRTVASPVREAAARLGLDCAQPDRLRDPALLDQWHVGVDLLIVVAYGLLLPAWMLAWPRVACVNLHASLLPRWRGAAPIQHAILAGDRDTGISVMRMDAGLDSGPVYASAGLSIEADETSGQLHDRLAALAADLLAEHIDAIREQRLTPVPQDDRLASYAPKLDKSAAPLDWRLPATQLERRVRAFNPWPVAEAHTTDGRRLRIWAARAVPGIVDAAPGTVLAAGAAGIDVATAEQILRLEIVQPPSGKAMPAAAYLAAHPLDGTDFAS
jgi:methionyl-tRNA formyltransferase